MIRAVKLMAYIVRHDSGFSPNPFGGVCTLACCKPAIRRSAEGNGRFVSQTTHFATELRKDGLISNKEGSALVRCAAALGCDAVLLSPRCADPFGWAAVRASAGA